MTTIAATPNLTIPPVVATQDDLTKWYKLQEELESIKIAELELRKKIFGSFFITPKEGTNTADLSDGWKLKGGYKINRSIDVALLTAHVQELHAKGIPVDSLIKYKPELITAPYRALTDVQRLEFDKVLDIKIGTPSLEIVLPKRST